MAVNVKKPKPVVKREFEISAELKDIAEKVISAENMELSPATVEYLLVYPNISKVVAGRCVRSGKELRFFSGYDYLIEISGQLWDALDDSVRYVLLHHELMHIMPVMNDKTGEWKFELRKHDIEDFSNIIKKHGIDWISKVKLGISSLYDLTPAQEDKIVI